MSFRGFTKAVGDWTLAAVGLGFLVVVGMGFVYGAVWLATKLYPIVNWLADIGFAALLLCLLPSAIFKGSRRHSGNGVVIVSYVWGVSLWMYCILVLYQLWGVLGIYLGFATLGIGTVPLACVALLFKGAWGIIGQVALGVLIVYATRLLGIWIASKADTPSDMAVGPVRMRRTARRSLKSTPSGGITDDLDAALSALPEPGEPGTLASDREVCPKPKAVRPSASDQPDLPVEGLADAKEENQVRSGSGDGQLPTSLAALAATLLESAIGCATSLENKTGQLRDRLPARQEESGHCVFQDEVQEFVICFLHMTDRQVLMGLKANRLSVLSVELREAFMDLLLPAVSACGETMPMSTKHPIPAFARDLAPGLTMSGLDTDLYNSRQQEYSRLKLFNPAGQGSLKGTVTWALGAHVAQRASATGSSEIEQQLFTHMVAQEASGLLVPEVARAVDDFTDFLLRQTEDETNGRIKPTSGPGEKAGARGKASAPERSTDPSRVRKILKELDEAYPAAASALHHDDPFQLLVAAILSAQCTDERVNQITPDLFRKYRTPEHFAYADPGELEQEIRSTGLHRVKARLLMGSSKRIVEEFDGKVPRSMDEMLTLPGVARATANVVLGTAYGIASGVVVDIRVQCVAQRLDLTKNKDPKGIEQDLMEAVPKDRWILFSHQVILHGRRVCQALRPKCAECALEEVCYAKDKTYSSC